MKSKRAKEYFVDVYGYNILRPFSNLPIFYFFSPQEKRIVSIGDKYGI